jgi:dihydrofolate reductase
MTLWHCHIAVSLDMRIARADGSVDWLEKYPPDGLGFDAFLAGCDAILMGRATYDVIRRWPEWPYPGRPTVVLTSRPLDAGAPPEIEARGGEIGAVVAEIEARGYARVWVEGGGKLVRDMLRLGKLDVLEVALIPIVLGEGVPLFPEGTPETGFTLASGQPWMEGAMHLVYRRREAD